MADEVFEDVGPEIGERRNIAQVALDKALHIQGSAIEKNIARARQRNPDATPEEVIRVLENIYRGAQAGSGLAVGAAAAAPAVGTGAALALAGGEVLSGLQLTTLYVLSLAQVHGLRVDELERRRTLVLGILIGGGGGETITKISERTGQHWAKQIVSKVPASKLLQINKVLGKNFVTKYGTKQGVLVLGKVVPFGIGAVIGGTANLLFAEATIRASRRAFGPAPTSWPEEPLSEDSVLA